MAVWTRSRAEKAVARSLEDCEIEHWLPLVTVRRRWSDRWSEVDLPLFPGYLFARVPEDDWLGLLRLPGVLTVVKNGRQPARIREQQIADLRLAIVRVMSGKEQLEVVQDFEPGDRVKVVSGPMAGLVGVVRATRGSRRLLVGFDQIGRALSVLIGRADVERCGE
jgi:transcription antitermination factor NusG